MPIMDMFVMALAVIIHWFSEFWELLLLAIAAYALYVAAIHILHYHWDKRQ